MTEAEWLACDDPQAMLKRLRRRRNLERKLSLFACTCWRRVIPCMVAKQAVPDTFQTPKTPQALSAAINELEEYVDGLSQRERFLEAWDYLTLGIAREGGEQLNAKNASAWQIALWASWASGYWAYNRCPGPQVTREAARSAEWNAQTYFVRDIFGNSFRRNAFALAWRTATVASLAETIYAERAFDRLPILADALEDAGCTNRDILDHCRQPGEHARGCWVVDLVLGKS